jgi:hypothetical protein
MTWLLVAAWAVGFVIGVYPVYRLLSGHIASVDLSDQLLCAACGLVVTALWTPLVFLALVFMTSHRLWVGHWIPGEMRARLLPGQPERERVP